MSGIRDWRIAFVFAAAALSAGCENGTGPQLASEAASPWPATAEALLDEWAYAITYRSHDRFVALHETGVVLERPDVTDEDCLQPWQHALVCLPWLASGYWGPDVGDEVPCSPVDLGLDLQILQEFDRDVGRALLVRVAIQYWWDRETNLYGLSEARIRFEIESRREGWRIVRIVDETESRCP